MPRPLRINVIFADNGSGLSRDAIVVRQVLQRSGHRVSLTARSPRRYPASLTFAPELLRQTVRSAAQRWRQAWDTRAGRWDINIFLEGLVPEYFERARVNCLFPNAEWLSPADERVLHDVDVVCFKTQHAARLLARRVKQSVFTGFTSLDRLDLRIRQTMASALHVSGWNPHKGTQRVIAAWAANPHWPSLTIVSQLHGLRAHAPNIAHLARRVSDGRLRYLQNACGINVCPSEVEGFGHTLMEALSCGAIAITTGAPPMNDLISEEVGFHVPFSHAVQMGAATRYLIDAEDLAGALDRVWRLEPARIRRMRRAARAEYERLRATFCTQFNAVINAV